MDRYRQGYEDGSGQECIVDTVLGKAVAVTNWGCSCCQPTLTDEHSQQAATIVAALNGATRAVPSRVCVSCGDARSRTPMIDNRLFGGSIVCENIRACNARRLKRR